MAQFGFVGPIYASQSLNADAQRTVNWYPESIESGLGKGAYALYPTPGLAPFATLVAGSPPGGVRGAIAINGRAFFAVGNLFAEINSAGKVIAGTRAASAMMACRCQWRPVHRRSFWRLPAWPTATTWATTR
jgi:hypothetical protein